MAGNSWPWLYKNTILLKTHQDWCHQGALFELSEYRVSGNSGSCAKSERYIGELGKKGRWGGRKEREKGRMKGGREGRNKTLCSMIRCLVISVREQKPRVMKTQGPKTRGYEARKQSPCQLERVVCLANCSWCGFRIWRKTWLVRQEDRKWWN